MPILSDTTRATSNVTYPGIVDAVPDPVLVVDAGGVVRFANARAAVFFGRPDHRLVGRPVGELVPGLGEAARRLLESGSAEERLELAVAGDVGPGRRVEVCLARVATQPGDMVAATVRDDQDGRSLHDASAQLRDELFASVSHELRTPLTSIIGYTELLADLGEGALSGRAAELIAVIERNAERELRLVEDLLTLTSLGSQALVVEQVPTALGPIVEEAVTDHAARAAEAGVELVVVAGVPADVCGDRVRLRQVVGNLLGNAVKFTPAGGRVTVTTSVEVRHGVLTVEDQGVGVTAEELPRLFDGLFRGTHAVTEHLPGAGLGLPIVKGIVEAHGGEVDVASRPGHGTRVEVRIPRADGPA